MRPPTLQSEFLSFIVENHFQPGDMLPTIQEISTALGFSVAKTREALEVARMLGIVDVKPGRGTRLAEYTFTPAVTLSSLYAISQKRSSFEQLRQLRNVLEISFWGEAASRLTPEDIAQMRQYVDRAREALAHQPIRVPASEHREFHLTIFRRLENLFVLGILEAFWAAYEAFGLNLYVELDYHRRVWGYHERIVDALEAGQIDEGRRLLIEHMNLIQDRGHFADDTTTANVSVSRVLFD